MDTSKPKKSLRRRLTTVLTLAGLVGAGLSCKTETPELPEPTSQPTATQTTTQPTSQPASQPSIYGDEEIIKVLPPKPYPYNEACPIRTGGFEPPKHNPILRYPPDKETSTQPQIFDLVTTIGKNRKELQDIMTISPEERASLEIQESQKRINAALTHERLTLTAENFKHLKVTYSSQSERDRIATIIIYPIYEDNFSFNTKDRAFILDADFSNPDMFGLVATFDYSPTLDPFNGRNIIELMRNYTMEYNKDVFDTNPDFLAIAKWIDTSGFRTPKHMSDRPELYKAMMRRLADVYTGCYPLAIAQDYENFVNWRKQHTTGQADTYPVIWELTSPGFRAGLKEFKESTGKKVVYNYLPKKDEIESWSQKYGLTTTEVGLYQETSRNMRTALSKLDEIGSEYALSPTAQPVQPLEDITSSGYCVVQVGQAYREQGEHEHPAEIFHRINTFDPENTSVPVNTTSGLMHLAYNTDNKTKFVILPRYFTYLSLVPHPEIDIVGHAHALGGNPDKPYTYLLKEGRFSEYLNKYNVPTAIKKLKNKNN